MKKKRNEAGGAATLRDSFRFAFAGLGYAVRRERNVKIHLATTGAILVVAALLGVGREELALLLLAIGAVIAAELMNTAIEVTVDLACERQFHPLALTAKNVAAGGVLVSAMVAFLVGLAVLGPRAWEMLSTWLP